MKKKTEDAAMYQRQVRMDKTLETRIRAYQKQLKRATGGLVVSFSTASRLLIEKGLDSVRL
jgi:hypothetical protein